MVYSELDAGWLTCATAGRAAEPGEVARDHRDDIWVHDPHNSTALEGNTLVLREVGRQRGPGTSRRHDIQPFPA